MKTHELQPYSLRPQMTSFRIPATTTGTSAQKAREAKIQLRSAIYYCPIRDITMATILGGFTPYPGTRRWLISSPRNRGTLAEKASRETKGSQGRPRSTTGCMIYARPGSEIRNSMIVQVGRSGPALRHIQCSAGFPDSHHGPLLCQQAAC